MSDEEFAQRVAFVRSVLLDPRAQPAALRRMVPARCRAAGHRWSLSFRDPTDSVSAAKRRLKVAGGV
jgi:hypothetical protein